MKKIEVVLSDYDPNWEEQFLVEKRSIQEAIGHSILGIEHIGSTSIKGLKAKPIIDILLGVQSIEGVSELIEDLRIIGYEYVPKPELMDRRFLEKGYGAKELVIYIYVNITVVNGLTNAFSEIIFD